MEDVKILKDFISENVTEDCGIVYSTEIQAIENIISKIETVKIFVTGKKKEIEKYSSKIMNKTSVINLLRDIEELLGEEWTIK